MNAFRNILRRSLMGVASTMCMVAATSWTEGAETADLVLTGGKVAAVDPFCAGAEAVAVRGERIVAVGGAADVAALIGPHTRVIQLQGELVVPGLIEGHGHFLALGESRRILDLSTADTWDDIVAQVAAAAARAPAGTWILGRGWHQSKWRRSPEPNVEGTPTHAALTRVAPLHPVLLTHASGHMCIANATALELAGVRSDTPAPAGGKILRDAAGEPTGVLQENAMELVERAHAHALAQRSAEQQREDTRAVIRLAADECLRHGVTTFCDAGSSLSVIDTYRELAEAGELPVRLWVMINEDNSTLATSLDRYRIVNASHHHLTVRAIKRLMDGALGSHTAWLLEPYDDLPTSRGLNTIALEELRRTAELALAHNYQLCVHAIGDRANREVLDLYADVFRSVPNHRQLRWRIEHAQHLDPADIPRFHELGVIAAMQAVHATSDGPFVVERLGRRRAQVGAYAWKSLLDTGAIVVNGSDTPVERVDPLAGFYAAVTRDMGSDRADRFFFPEQCMSREQALQSYTRDAAYAAFEDDVKGSLTAGKLADIVVLSQDILTVPADQLRATRVRYTIVGGKVLYESPR
jgi:predicted amidohydrolase YtcJ